jgi:hypothetical protein
MEGRRHGGKSLFMERFKLMWVLIVVVDDSVMIET